MACVVCAGRDENCKECSGTGNMKITSCPHDLIPGDVWEVLKISGFARKGILPVAGGLLDQTKSFIDSLDRIWAEESHWRRQIGIFTSDE